MSTTSPSHLYALPDHEVMQALLPGIERRRVSAATALQALAERPGLTPIAIDATMGGQLYLADIGDTPLLEWKHIYTIERLAREGRIEYSISAPLTLLEEQLPEPGPVPLHGLIMHVSRCGSTLLTKALARSPKNLTVIQGGPLQEGFWSVVSDFWRRQPEPDQRNLTMLRNLVALLVRQRRPEHTRSFVKFISWNTVYFDFIRAAFPTVPILYIYRDPAEVIAMILRETTAALRTQGTDQAAVLTGLPREATASLDPVEYLAHCYAHYFDIVLDNCNRGLSLVGYQQLRYAAALDPVLERGFGLALTEDELAAMREQYRYYSKDDSNRTPYQGEPDLLGRLSTSQLEAVRRVVGSRLEALDRADANLAQRPETEYIIDR